MTLPSAPAVERHSAFEDAFALVSGTLFISLAVTLLQGAGLLTGGTAGLAFLIHYATGIGFGIAFFVINLPFYWFAWRHMGRAFTLKTFATVALLSAFTQLMPQVFAATAQPLYAAAMGGMLAGMGLLILIRHRASLGGIGILAFALQERRGWRAGKVQMAVDCAIVAAAFAVADTQRVLLSIAGALALNMVLAVNHKPGRYVAM